MIVCAFTSGGGTFTPDADSVTIDGFTFEGNPNGAGVETTSNYSGYTVINTVFTNNSMGVDPGSNGIQPSVFTRNLYVANNNGFGGNGVFTSDWWALSNASFTDSSFSGNNNTPIDIDGRAARVGVDVATGITITGNDMVGEGPIFIVSVTDAKISDNTTTGGFSGVELSGNDHNVTVTNNTITDKTHGSVVVVTSNDQRPNTNVTIADNTMERTATAAGRAAIDISGSSAIAITSNLILDSGNNGIAVGIRGKPSSRDCRRYPAPARTSPSCRTPSQGPAASGSPLPMAPTPAGWWYGSTGSWTTATLTVWSTTTPPPPWTRDGTGGAVTSQTIRSRL
ncbi:right-handed parallel beta-helix repeat-containing protein [Catenulispora yoronensis]